VKLYTKTGDRGETALLGGVRVSKAHPRVEAYGEVDELNAWLGVVRASGVDADLDEMLQHLQRDLFALGSRLADPAHKIAERVTKANLGASDVERLEGWIDKLESELPPLRRFILAGGSRAGAALHVARTVCRRAERSAWAVVEVDGERTNTAAIRYLNRLSDLLFILSRIANPDGDVKWVPGGVSSR
jgi:cob(I)alamin adenosyltransferase